MAKNSAHHDELGNFWGPACYGHATLPERINRTALDRACRAWINAASAELTLPRSEFIFGLKRWFKWHRPGEALFGYDDLAFIRQAYALWSAHT